MAEPSNSYLGGYVAMLAALRQDKTLLIAAKRLDPDHTEFHDELFTGRGAPILDPKEVGRDV